MNFFQYHFPSVDTALRLPPRYHNQWREKERGRKAVKIGVIGKLYSLLEVSTLALTYHKATEQLS
jgi:hypothetical protein